MRTSEFRKQRTHVCILDNNVYLRRDKKSLKCGGCKGIYELLDRSPEGDYMAWEAIDYKLPFSTAMKFRDAFKAVGSIAENMHEAEPILVKKEGGGTHETAKE